jgi:hypothetical protein
MSATSPTPMLWELVRASIRERPLSVLFAIAICLLLALVIPDMLVRSGAIGLVVHGVVCMLVSDIVGAVLHRAYAGGLGPCRPRLRRALWWVGGQIVIAGLIVQSTLGLLLDIDQAWLSAMAITWIGMMTHVIIVGHAGRVMVGLALAFLAAAGVDVLATLEGVIPSALHTAARLLVHHFANHLYALFFALALLMDWLLMRLRSSMPQGEHRGRHASRSSRQARGGSAPPAWRLLRLMNQWSWRQAFASAGIIAAIALIMGPARLAHFLTTDPFAIVVFAMLGQLHVVMGESSRKGGSRRAAQHFFAYLHRCQLVPGHGRALTRQVLCAFEMTIAIRVLVCPIVLVILAGFAPVPLIMVPILWLGAWILARFITLLGCCTLNSDKPIRLIVFFGAMVPLFPGCLYLSHLYESAGILPVIVAGFIVLVVTEIIRIRAAEEVAHAIANPQLIPA